MHLCLQDVRLMDLDEWKSSLVNLILLELDKVEVGPLFWQGLANSVVLLNVTKLRLSQTNFDSVVP